MVDLDAEISEETKTDIADQDTRDVPDVAEVEVVDYE